MTTTTYFDSALSRARTALDAAAAAARVLEHSHPESRILSLTPVPPDDPARNDFVAVLLRGEAVEVVLVGVPVTAAVDPQAGGSTWSLCTI